jgi:hypothetical protein
MERNLKLKVRSQRSLKPDEEFHFSLFIMGIIKKVFKGIFMIK